MKKQRYKAYGSLIQFFVKWLRSELRVLMNSYSCSLRSLWSSGSKSFKTKKSNLLRLQIVSSTVLLCFTTLTATAGDGFDTDYEILSGDHNNDGYIDLLVSKPKRIVFLAGEIVTSIVVPNGEDDFVLEQGAGGDFSIVPVGSQMPIGDSRWSQTDIVINAVDFNVDNIADIILTGIETVIFGAEDLIVFAEPGKGSLPQFSSFLDENAKEFIEQAYQWFVDPDYFSDIAYTEVDVTGWYILREILNLNVTITYGGFAIDGTWNDQNVTPDVCSITSCFWSSIEGWLIYLAGYSVEYDFSKPEINQSALEYSRLVDNRQTVTVRGKVLPGWLVVIPWLLDAYDAWTSRNDWPEEYDDIGIDEEYAMILVNVVNYVCRDASELPSPDFEGASPADVCYVRAGGVIGEGDANIALPETIVDHDRFDLDELAKYVPVLQKLEEKAKRSKTRHHCTYIKRKGGSGAYYGRTTAVEGETCQTAVARRDTAHTAAGYLVGFSNGIVDSDNVGVGGYSVMRGREQQLIDQHVYDLPMPWTAETHGLDYKPFVWNRIRGVARLNSAGCVYWTSSSFAEGQIGPYTGRTSSPVISCGNVPAFPP